MIMSDLSRSVFKSNSSFTLALTIFLVFTLVFSSFMFSIADFGQHNVRSSRAYDFEIEFSTSDFIVEPNSEDTVKVILDNKGDSEDTYDLTFKNVPSGWSAQFLTDKGKLEDSYSLLVGTEGYKTIHIYITAPDGGEGTLKVGCKSTTTKDAKTAEIYLKAEKILTISLLDKNPQRRVDAGSGTIFNFEIKNHQNNPDEVALSFQNKDIKIQSTPDDFDWAVSFDNIKITLNAGELKNVTLTVYAPTLGLPGDKINIQAIANPALIDQTFKFPELIVEIPTVFNITYKLSQETLLTFPNSTINYTLKLFNEGNIKSTVSLLLHDNPDNWDVEFFIDNNQTKPEDIELDIDGIVNFRIQIKIPKGANAGSYKIIYGLYGKDKTAAALSEIEILINVSLISGIDIIVPKDMLIDLGKTTKLQIMLHNKGNGMDTLNISIFKDSIPTDWDVYFDGVLNTPSDIDKQKTVDFTRPIKIASNESIEYLPISDSKYQSLSLTLEANKKAYLSLSIITPTSGNPSSESITIYGESESSTLVTIIKKLSVGVRVSDLILSGFNIAPKSPYKGEKVIAKVNVTNNFHLPATNLRVKLRKLTDQDPITIKTFDISNLPAGEIRTVEFIYEEDTETFGEYVLETRLSASYLSADKELTLPVTVSEKPEEKDDSAKYRQMISILSIAIIIAIIIFLLIWLYFSKKYKATDEGEKEDKLKKSKDGRVSLPTKRKEPLRTGKTKQKTGKKDIKPTDTKKDKSKGSGKKGKGK